MASKSTEIIIECSNQKRYFIFIHYLFLMNIIIHIFNGSKPPSILVVVSLRLPKFIVPI